MDARRFRWAALLAGAVLIVSACGNPTAQSTAAPDTGTPYRVVVSTGVSTQGALAANSATAALAAEAAAKRINAEGGVAGRPIEIIKVDDGGDPTKALTALREVVDKQKVDAYINAGPSTLSAAVLPVLARNNIIFMNNGPTAEAADPKAYPLAFNLPTLPDVQIKAFVATVKAEGFKKVAVLHGNTAFGKLFGSAAPAAFTAAGFEVVGTEEFNAAALDMTPQVAALKGKAPDVVVMNGYGAAVGYVLKGMQTLNWDVPILGDTAVAATGLLATAPPTGLVGTPEVKNLRIEVMKSTSYDPNDKAANQLVEGMSTLGTIPSSLINAWNWDALLLLRAAAKKVGRADDPAALAKALEDPAVTRDAGTALLKNYNYSATSHAANADPSEFAFIPPALTNQGQFGRPAT